MPHIARRDVSAAMPHLARRDMSAATRAARAARRDFAARARWSDRASWSKIYGPSAERAASCGVFGEAKRALKRMRGCVCRRLGRRGLLFACLRLDRS
jgi:hypothetical protein